MFDDIPQKNPAPPSNLPTEPVDMFEDLEKDSAVSMTPEPPSALEAGILKKKSPGITPLSKSPTVMPGLEPDYPVRGPVIGKIITVLVILVVSAVVGYLAWRIYDFFSNRTPVSQPTSVETQPVTKTEDVIPTNEEPSMENEAMEEPAVLTPILDESVDTDKDGLNDVREEELGTDLNNPDTDNDGLRDGDEVLIWKTNPLNQDTDNDTYLDGEEVLNGYNPLGQGKILVGEEDSSVQPEVVEEGPEEDVGADNDEEPII